MSLGSVPLQKQPTLLAESEEETSVVARCLLATAVITIFSVSSKKIHQGDSGSWGWVLLSHGLSAWRCAYPSETSARRKARERCGSQCVCGGRGGYLLSTGCEETLEEGLKP